MHAHTQHIIQDVGRGEDEKVNRSTRFIYLSDLNHSFVFLCVINHFFVFIYFHLYIFLCIYFVNVRDSITVDHWSVLWTTWFSWSVQMHARMHTRDEEFCLLPWAADCPSHLSNHAIFSPPPSNRCASLLFHRNRCHTNMHTHMPALLHLGKHILWAFICFKTIFLTHTRFISTSCTSQSDIITWYMDQYIWSFTVYRAGHRSM